MDYDYDYEQYERNSVPDAPTEMLTQSRLQDVLLQLWRSSPSVHQIPILDVSLVPTRILDELAEAETTIERLQNQLNAQQGQIQQRQQLLLSLEKAQMDLRDAATDLEQERVLRRYQNKTAVKEMKAVEAVAMDKLAEMEMRRVKAEQTLIAYISQNVAEEGRRGREIAASMEKAKEEERKGKEEVMKLQGQLAELREKAEISAQAAQGGRKMTAQEGGEGVPERESKVFAAAKDLIAKSASGNRCLFLHSLHPSVDLPATINEISGAKVEAIQYSKWSPTEAYIQFLHEGDAENYLHMVTNNPAILGAGIKVQYGPAIAPIKKEIANHIAFAKATRIIRIYAVPLNVNPLQFFPFMELAGGNFRHIKMMGTAIDSQDVQIEFSSVALAVSAVKKISQDAVFGRFETGFVVNEVDISIEKYVLACMGRGVKIPLPVV